MTTAAKVEHVTLPLVLVGASAAFQGYLLYRLPDEVRVVTDRPHWLEGRSHWSFRADTAHPVVVCERAENGVLYALHVHEGRR